MEVIIRWVVDYLLTSLPSLEGYTPVTFFIALVTPCSVFQVRILNVISLCRNNSDGVRPLIPPGFLYLFYHLTNRASYLSLPSSMFELCSAAATTHFSLSCYMPILFCSVYRIWESPYLLCCYLQASAFRLWM